MLAHWGFRGMKWPVWSLRGGALLGLTHRHLSEFSSRSLFCRPGGASRGAGGQAQLLLHLQRPHHGVWAELQCGTPVPCTPWGQPCQVSPCLCPGTGLPEARWSRPSVCCFPWGLYLRHLSGGVWG